MTKKILLAILVTLIIVRLALPHLALSFINKKLDQNLGVYQGHVSDLDIGLYRGSYQLQELVIKKRDADEAAKPLLRVEEVDLSVSWKALFKGELALDVVLFRPEVNLSDSGSKNKKQLGVEEKSENWKSAYNTIIPTSVQNFIVHEGIVAFVNRDLETPLPVKLSHIELTVQNIQIREQESLSPIDLKATMQDHAQLSLDGILNFDTYARWDTNFKFEDFKLESINKTLRAYIPLDVTKGMLSFFGEAKAENNNIEGYAKVFLNDADIIENKQKFISFEHFLYEIITAFSNWFLQNDDSENVAIHLPFKRTDGKWDLDTSEAFWSAIENKSDELKRGLDNSIGLD